MALLHNIELRNILSFGPGNSSVDLEPLNVVIGPNGSGKSNLIEAICLQRASVSNLQDVLRKGGGVLEWIWKGAPEEPAEIRVIILSSIRKIVHSITFVSEGQVARIESETIMGAQIHEDPPQFEHYYMYQNGKPELYTNNNPLNLDKADIKANRSILAQLRDPIHYPAITDLVEQYEGIRAYREWSFGRNTIFRQPQPADGRTDRLEEDFSNLGMFLNRLQSIPQVKKRLLTYLRDVYDGIDDFGVKVIGGTVQVLLTEGDFSIPATRLSDGTLRYLCLLAILCDPTPPPLICIEEPELGLHPDIIPKLADLLKEASQRTQLIVTTHSDILVDAMSDQPESVLVCEKHEGQTQLKRLDPAELKVWLNKYRLGELWMRGEIGGTRWQ